MNVLNEKIFKIPEPDTEILLEEARKEYFSTVIPIKFCLNSRIIASKTQQLLLKTGEQENFQEEILVSIE